MTRQLLSLALVAFAATSAPALANTGTLELPRLTFPEPTLPGPDFPDPGQSCTRPATLTDSACEADAG